MRAARILTAVILVLTAAIAGSLVSAAPAAAADRGVGFGAWQPISPYGWHGSMIIDGVHTYCILPGAPLPTGASVDHGVSTTAAGLSPQQLTGINHLVTTYGQTDDPVQAAAVGWAVKAIANWDETLHHFGYPGDSLAGAIDWTFSRLAPEHNVAVQERAVAYYDEAARRGGVPGVASGSLVFTVDGEDHRRGSVRVEATTAGAVGTLTLVDAVFADTGSATREGVAAGTEYPIETRPPATGRAYAVSGTGSFSGGVAPAVRHFTTAAGQDTAGPGGPVSFKVSGADSAPRVPPFAPTITTQVASRYASGGPFVDDVRFVIEGEWPRAEDGSALPVTASATVYRTTSEPEESGSDVPGDAEPVGELTLTTGAAGADPVYRVTSDWELPGPGFYTAVWSVRGDAQSNAVAAHLPADFLWTEAFGVRSQVMVVPDVSSRAQERAVVGETLSDTVIVGGIVPVEGLQLSSALYRAPAGVAPAEACTPETLVWESETVHATAAGEYAVTAPAVTTAGTYYWREKATDASGELVHHGPCGLANETTVVEEAPAPTPSLAATGATPAMVGAPLVVGLTIVLTGIALGLSRRRRYGAAAGIG
jgi:hypothetical protein